MEISGFYSSSANLEILDDLMFFQQYDWAEEMLASVFCEERKLSEVEESGRPLKQLKTSPHYSFFNTTNNNCNLKTSSERILAERNRREKLSHRFVALSSLLPRLKKMDKASILREAIKHITELQEKVETLEKKKRCNDVVKSCSNQSLFSTVSKHTQSSLLPLVEGRMCSSEVLINIYKSERRKGVMERVISEIEKQHLSVVSCSFLPFGASALNITIVAQMEEEFGMSMEGVVKKLHAALQI